VKTYICLAEGFGFIKLIKL